MGIANKFAGAIAPIILASIILKDSKILEEKLAQAADAVTRTALLDELAGRVIMPYIVMTIILVLLGMLLKFAHLPEVDTDAEDAESGESNSKKTSVWQFPHLVLGVIALFFYVGVEVIAGDTIIRYGISQGIPISTAKVFTSYTLISMIVGYILGIVLIPKIITQRIALQISAIIGVVFSLIAIFTPPMISVTFIALLGLANALVWPAVWPLAIHELGRFIKTGAAILVMAISGGALLPLLWGQLSDTFNSQQAYWIMVPSYLVILLYSTRWYKLRSWK
jgi:glucose/galactose transporter